MTEDENLHEISLEMVSLFQNDLKTNIESFNHLIGKLQQSFDKNVILELVSVIKTIAVTSKIVHFKDLEYLLKNFIAYLQTINENLSEENLNLIKSVYKLLFEIIEVNRENVVKTIQNKRDEYNKLVDAFALNEAADDLKEPKVSWNVPEKKMLDLFKNEIELQIKTLSEGLLTYQHSPDDLHLLEPLMRAAHSIKGAAKVFAFQPMIKLSHAMEDCFVAAQEGKINLNEDKSEVLFQALDAIVESIDGPTSEIISKMSKSVQKFSYLEEKIKSFLQNKARDKSISEVQDKENISHNRNYHIEKQERVLRLTAQNLNRLMGLAAESMVETRWLRPFCDSLTHLKLKFNQLLNSLDFLKNCVNEKKPQDLLESYFVSLRHQLNDCQTAISDHIADLEMFITRHSNLTDRLYSEVIESRMRPFNDGISAFPRMVWETARHLKKKARLEIVGKNTLIDRDILEKLEAPLGHLLRNALDHGIEAPDIRIQKGKLPEGIISLKASHKGGMLLITVSDDGSGIDLNVIRQKVINDKLTSSNLVENMNDKELLDFLFLPGFSTANEVTDISGRGMGLNVVQNMLQEISGSLSIENRLGYGVSFHMQLPLTLSVTRALITRIDKSIFAFPLARIEQAVTVSKDLIQKVDKREYFEFMGKNVAIIPGKQVLGIEKSTQITSQLFIVILNNHNNFYGLVVDEFISEKELVLQDLESKLGKIPCVSSGSVMENGDPVLVVDVEDVITTIDKLIDAGLFYKFSSEQDSVVVKTKKRILVVDDSISVREVECRLLSNQGYIVDSAVNGADAWNAVRLEKYDLVVTDVDMPRMNGIELVRNIKNDAKLSKLPVMIVSYKERENDRLKGFDAGADYYLTKSTFGDDSLIEAVYNLIGEP